MHLGSHVALDLEHATAHENDQEGCRNGIFYMLERSPHAL